MNIPLDSGKRYSKFSRIFLHQDLNEGPDDLWFFPTKYYAYGINTVCRVCQTEKDGILRCRGMYDREMIRHNGFYYYVPHAGCKDIFNLNPLAYE